MATIEEYYNKFNEEKRLDSRHGRVEFQTTMKYIQAYLEELLKEKKKEEIHILDIGAGTGRYCIPLAEEGYQMSAVELVKHNLSRLKQKCNKVQAYQGNALNLKRFQDNTFDVTFLFGPMYHLHEHADKCQALQEAKRVTKPGGRIFVAYIMNEYSVITYAFKEKHIKENLKNHQLDETFLCQKNSNELYSMVRLEEIERINQEVGLKRHQIIAADGPANYMRRYLNALDEEEFGYFLEYHWATCERMDLMGASAHTVDILVKS